MELEPGHFYLGATVDPATGERTATGLTLDSANLTTHGVIVGMTGSGKTGLAIDVLEEALLAGIPCLIIDPKGDMTNLLLNFPDFKAEDFRPWIDEAAAGREGMTPDELAAKTAGDWKEGLASWEIGPDRLRQLGTGADFTIYTPGSTSGVSLNVLGSMAPPDLSWDEEAETLRAEIEGIVSSLLVLAGVEADPVSSPPHILLATIIEHAWRAGETVDLATLIGRIQQPPLRKLGVFEVDAFFPPKDRNDLAMKLNGLVASPSFAAWLEGAPLDIATMLEGDRPQAAIVYLAHLSDTEKQFLVTLLRSKVVTWFRRRSGSSSLSALVYMDEVVGFCPPSAEPPSKKPIMTIYKQARAFGVGMVLATQNPVDLDYKVMSNAGTWMVGRLQTERDKARIIEGITSATGGVDVAAFDKQISSLAKRQFLLHQAKAPTPQLFASRWAMSYLAGPLTKDQVETLAEDSAASPSRPAVRSTEVEPGAATEAPAPSETADAVPVAPQTAIEARYLDPAAPWAEKVGAATTPTVWEAGVAATVYIRYDDEAAGVAHDEAWEAVIFPLTRQFATDSVIAVDHDPRDFRTEVPAGARFSLPEAPIGEASYFKTLQSSLVDWLVRERKVTVQRNSSLKVYSRIGESEVDIQERCKALAADKADEEMAQLEDRFATRIDRVKDQLLAAENQVGELEVDVSSRRRQEVLGGAGDLLGALLGGRRSSAGLGRAAGRRRQTRVTEGRLETAREKIEDKAAELEELESDLADEIATITDKWDAAAATIEAVEIPLERTDVKVDSLLLVWLPR